jgi:hypothetical protein
VPQPCDFEFELAIEKLKSHKSPGIDQIPAVLIKARGKTIHHDIHKLILLFGTRSKCLRIGRSRSLYLSIRRAVKHCVVIIGAYHICKLRKNIIQNPAVKTNSTCRENYWGSSMWVLTQKVDHISVILHSSNA